MPYEVRAVEKRFGRYPGTKYLLVELGTARAALHRNEQSARVSLRYLNEGKARWCECDGFILGVPGRNEYHNCPCPP